MSYEDHSEDVASDFRDALSELTMNSRVEITTLTVIARENTEYAHGISEVLQEHIKKVRASTVSRTHLLCYCMFCILIFVLVLGCSSTKTAGPLPPRLHRQERRHPLHDLLRPRAVLDLHGRLRLCR